MSNTYTYGPLKSQYFSAYEKMWIEGFCKERSITLTESNVCSVLTILAKDGLVKDKAAKLLEGAEKFSSYAQSLITKSWNNILAYTMHVVQPSGGINENQVEAFAKTSKWWLTEAPKEIANEMKVSYFNGFVLEGVSNTGTILEDVKTFNPGIPSTLMETSKKFFSYDRIKMKFPPCRINTEEIKKNESILNMIPEADKLISMAAWTAETIKLISTVKK